MVLAGAPRISVLIATRGRPRLLVACLESLRRQEGAPPFEVLVATDVGDDLEALVAATIGDAVVAQTGNAQGAPLAPSDKRNLLFERATGDLLLFLDDDVLCSERLLAHLAALADAHPDVDVFGGPNVTPPGSSLVQLVQGAVLSSMVATGPTRRRFGPHPAGPGSGRSLTLCNLAVRRRAMVPFRSGLKTGEEIALFDELAQDGRPMLYDPSLQAFHERRPTIKAFTRQVFNYGRGRGRLLRRVPSTTRPEHLAPITLLAYFGALPLLALASPLALAPLGIYLAAVATQAVKVGVSLPRRGRRLSAALLASALVMIVHLAYGIGIIVGVVGPAPVPQRAVARWADALP